MLFLPLWYGTSNVVYFRFQNGPPNASAIFALSPSFFFFLLLKQVGARDDSPRSCFYTTTNPLNCRSQSPCSCCHFNDFSSNLSTLFTPKFLPVLTSVTALKSISSRTKFVRNASHSLLQNKPLPHKKRLVDENVTPTKTAY